FNHPPSPYLYTLSLHDALPIFRRLDRSPPCGFGFEVCDKTLATELPRTVQCGFPTTGIARAILDENRSSEKNKTICYKRSESRRSEEHTSELQSRFDLVCRLLL